LADSRVEGHPTVPKFAGSLAGLAALAAAIVNVRRPHRGHSPTLAEHRDHLLGSESSTCDDDVLGLNTSDVTQHWPLWPGREGLQKVIDNTADP
jgi:hypothetical protein